MVLLCQRWLDVRERLEGKFSCVCRRARFPGPEELTSPKNDVEFFENRCLRKSPVHCRLVPNRNRSTFHIRSSCFSQQPSPSTGHQRRTSRFAKRWEHQFHGSRAPQEGEKPVLECDNVSRGQAIEFRGCLLKNSGRAILDSSKRIKQQSIEKRMRRKLTVHPTEACVDPGSRFFRHDSRLSHDLMKNRPGVNRYPRDRGHHWRNRLQERRWATRIPWSSSASAELDCVSFRLTYPSTSIHTHAPISLGHCSHAGKTSGRTSGINPANWHDLSNQHPASSKHRAFHRSRL